MGLAEIILSTSARTFRARRGTAVPLRCHCGACPPPPDAQQHEEQRPQGPCGAGRGGRPKGEWMAGDMEQCGANEIKTDDAVRFGKPARSQGGGVRTPRPATQPRPRTPAAANLGQRYRIALIVHFPGRPTSRRWRKLSLDQGGHHRRLGRWAPIRRPRPSVASTRTDPKRNRTRDESATALGIANPNRRKLRDCVPGRGLYTARGREGRKNIAPCR